MLVPEPHYHILQLRHRLAWVVLPVCATMDTDIIVDFHGMESGMGETEVVMLRFFKWAPSVLCLTRLR